MTFESWDVSIGTNQNGEFEGVVGMAAGLAEPAAAGRSAARAATVGAHRGRGFFPRQGSAHPRSLSRASLVIKNLPLPLAARSAVPDAAREQVLISTSTRSEWLSNATPSPSGHLLACDGHPRGEVLHDLTLFSTYFSTPPHHDDLLLLRDCTQTYTGSYICMHAHALTYAAPA
jgi:hypothetical protein